jgi:hypothetical protein
MTELAGELSLTLTEFGKMWVFHVVHCQLDHQHDFYHCIPANIVLGDE